MTDKHNCPRGFKWSKSKNQCVPEGSEISDKLELKYERYFFKEDKNMDKTCDKEGYRWCPVMQKCMPPDHFKGKGQRMHRGQGKGPMGNPMKEAEALVDLAFDESFEIFGKVVKAEKQVSKILDALGEKQDEVELGQGSSIQMRPYDHPKKVRPVVDVDECGMMGGGMMNKGIVDMDAEPEEEYEDDYESTPNDDETNDISHVPNQDAKSLYQSIISQLSEINSLSEDRKAEYKKYFDGMLKKFGVTSPAQLDDAKKKAFFDAVDRGWKAKKETD